MSHQPTQPLPPVAAHGAASAEGASVHTTLYNGRKASHQIHGLIVGCGMGGLAAAHCLGKAGHKVILFEAASAIGEVGAGIQAERHERHGEVEQELVEVRAVDVVNDRLRSNSNRLVLAHPDDGFVESWTAEGSADKMRADFADFEPRLRKILSFVQPTQPTHPDRRRARDRPRRQRRDIKKRRRRPVTNPDDRPPRRRVDVQTPEYVYDPVPVPALAPSGADADTDNDIYSLPLGSAPSDDYIECFTQPGTQSEPEPESEIESATESWACGSRSEIEDFTSDEE
ncbi:hypothetical protein LXA43DRAFT_1097694 [Ganoderma leucocontextum]|nr:hypothetical protein LXA43DRAFT_1097694 [Ganoderma leucocontextum]